MDKASRSNTSEIETPLIAKDELYRIVEIGRLLLSVLSDEEVERLQQLLDSSKAILPSKN